MKKFNHEKIIKVSFVVVIAFFVFVVIFIRYIDQKMKSDIKAVKTLPSEPAKQYRLVTPATGDNLAVKPAYEGIVVQSTDSISRTQEELEASVKEKFAKIRAEEPEKAKKMFSQMQVSEEEYEQKIARISQRLEELKKVAEENPYDEEVQDDLHALRSLLALTKAVREDVVKE